MQEIPIEDHLCIVDDMQQDSSVNKQTNFSLSNKLNQHENTLNARLNTEENRLFLNNYKTKFEDHSN